MHVTHLGDTWCSRATHWNLKYIPHSVISSGSGYLFSYQLYQIDAVEPSTACLRKKAFEWFPKGATYKTFHMLLNVSRSYYYFLSILFVKVCICCQYHTYATGKKFGIPQTISGILICHHAQGNPDYSASVLCGTIIFRI